jgi:hypothetical protein
VNSSALLPSSAKTDDCGETTGTTENRPSSPTRPYGKLQPKPQVTVRLAESGNISAAIPEESAGISLVESEDMVEQTIFSARIEPGRRTLPFKTEEDVCDETPILQMAQVRFHIKFISFKIVDPNNQDGHHASHETDTQDSKWERLAHDLQSLPHIGDGVPNSQGQTLVRGVLVATGDNQDTHQADQRPSDELRRKTKRRKLDYSLSILDSDYETHSLPSNSSLVSDEVSCIPDKADAGGKSITILSAKRPSKRTKGKKPGQSSQPKGMGPETHPLQDGEILDVCCHPSSDHDQLDILDDVHLAIMKSEGGQQAQDSQPINEDLELVTGHSKHQSSMAVLDSEGPREISSCCTNSVSMGDSEKLQHLASSDISPDSNFTDDTSMLT